jgi:uncharacterized protein (DUF58 family)
MLLLVSGQFFDPMYLLAKILLPVFAVLLVFDAALLFLTGRPLVLLRRILPERLSNGDENMVVIYVTNNHFFKLQVEIIDEIPAQFQIRDFVLAIGLKPQQEHTQFNIGLTQRSGENMSLGIPMLIFRLRWVFGAGG